MSNDHFVLETPRTRLRRLEEADRALFAAMNADPRVMEFYPSVSTREASDAEFAKIQAHWDKHGFGFCAMDVDGVFAGMLGLKYVSIEAHFTPAVELGYRLMPQHWNQGLTTEASRAALDYGFRELRLPEIVAYTYEGNHRSRRVMEKLGMQFDSGFAHPWLEEDHWLLQHVLYRKRKNGD